MLTGGTPTAQWKSDKGCCFLVSERQEHYNPGTMNFVTGASLMVLTKVLLTQRQRMISTPRYPHYTLNGTMKRKSTKKAAKRIIKEAAKHPDHYTQDDVAYAFMVLRMIKTEKKRKKDAKKTDPES